MKECEAKLNVQKWMKLIFNINNKRELLRAQQNAESPKQFPFILNTG